MHSKKLSWLAGLSGLVVLVAASSTAAAQAICTSPAAGEYEIDSGGASFTVVVVAGRPRVDNVPCPAGGVTTSIAVIGTAASERVTFKNIAPTIALTAELGDGFDTVLVVETTAPMNTVCTANGADRDGDLTPDLDLGGGVERLEFAGRSGNDVIDCSLYTGPLRLYGYDGDDVLVGGLGNDILFGGDGDDTLAGGPGADQLQGDDGADFEAGEDGNDTFVQRAQADPFDEISGGAGMDRLTYAARTAGVVVGPTGEDTLDGTIEIIYGGSGDDLIDVSEGSIGFILYGRGGADTLVGGPEADRLYGEGGADSLEGGPGDDYLDGGLDADFLIGEAGKDRLSAGAGDDVIGDTGEDGSVDAANCGEGIDEFTSNAEDWFVNCELDGAAPVPAASHRDELFASGAAIDAPSDDVPTEVAGCAAGAGGSGSLLGGLVIALGLALQRGQRRRRG